MFAVYEQPIEPAGSCELFNIDGSGVPQAKPDRESSFL
jgi:hypothetical protein